MSACEGVRVCVTHVSARMSGSEICFVSQFSLYVGSRDGTHVLDFQDKQFTH